MAFLGERTKQFVIWKYFSVFEHLESEESLSLNHSPASLCPNDTSSLY